MAELPAPPTAFAEIALASPQAVMARLCARFAEFGEVTATGRCSRIETGFGSADLEACERCLKVLATGRDDSSLAYTKLAVAEHLLHLAGDEQPSIVWTGDGATGRPLPYFREMRVVGARDIAPHMRRLTLAGEDLARFVGGGLHVRLLFPPSRAAPPRWPVCGADGRPQWPQGEERPLVRIYTIRAIDVQRGEVEIDFVLHQGDAMPGARFAAEARPGDIVGMTGPGGGCAGEADWYLLAGDDTALPAIARMLEAMPAGKRAVVRIEVDGSGDEQDIRSAANVDLRWLHRNGAEPGTTALLENAVRAVDWPRSSTRVFAWAGCEHGSFRAIRRYFRAERGLTREQHLVAAYWRRGYEGDTARRDEN